jgi:hypothetical protein
MGYIQFGSWTSDPLTFGSGNTEFMRIDALGNVGIGTTNPTAPLTINATTAGPALSIEQSVPTAGATIVLRGGGTTAHSYRIQSDNSGIFRIRDVTASSDRIWIDTVGNVGIGTNIAPGRGVVCVDSAGNFFVDDDGTVDCF